MSKSLEESVRKEFVRSLSRIQIEMMNSCGGSGIEQEDEDRIESEADRLLTMFNSSLAQYEKRIEDINRGHQILIETLIDTKNKELAQYKREIREKIGMMSIYDIDDTPRSVINMHGYNDAIKDVLAELDKLNHTDKKEGGK